MRIVREGQTENRDEWRSGSETAGGTGEHGGTRSTGDADDPRSGGTGDARLRLCTGKLSRRIRGKDRLGQKRGVTEVRISSSWRKSEE